MYDLTQLDVDDLKALKLDLQAKLESLSANVADGTITGGECLRLEAKIRSVLRDIRAEISKHFRGFKRRRITPDTPDLAGALLERQFIPLSAAHAALRAGNLVVYRPQRREIAAVERR